MKRAELFSIEYGPLPEGVKYCGGNIKALANCIVSDEEDGSIVFDPNYNEHFVTRWMVNAVGGIFGYVNPLVLILIGERQNTGKTHFFRNFLPEYLKRFFAETKLDDLKESDLAMKMHENLFVFDDEMSGRTKQDQKRLKYLTSVNQFTIRKPYQRTMEKVNRLATLCGTSNDMYLIADPTGNRRLVPLHVVKIKHEEYNQIDKEALWMEAYLLFRQWEANRSWELKKDDITFLNENTQCFQSIDRDLELLMHCFEVPQPGDWGGTTADLTASQIASHIEIQTRQKVDPKNLGIRLKKMVFVGVQTYCSEGITIKFIIPVCRILDYYVFVFGLWAF